MFEYVTAADQIRLVVLILLRIRVGDEPESWLIFDIIRSLRCGAIESYTLVATPKGGQTGNGMLIISNTGARGWDRNDNGAIDADENCWDKKCG